MSQEQSARALLTIAAAERESGLSKDTLRVWERRYGFPRPQRDVLGDRRYSPEDIERLRLLKQLIDLGYRAGQVVPLPADELRQLLEQSTLPLRQPLELPAVETIEQCMEAIGRHDAEGLNTLLERARLELGVSRFVCDLIAPLTWRVGEAWSQGRIGMSQEHLFTAAVQHLLHVAVRALATTEPARQPVVLLTTLAGEQHGIGLLMVQAMCALSRARTVMLGVNTPLDEIVRAVEGHGADVLGLSCSGVLPAPAVIEGLTELRRRLAPEVEIWAGGSAPVLKRRPVTGVQVIDDVIDVPLQLQHWRAQREQSAQRA